MDLPNNKASLADLSLPVRLVLAAFLITVGLGYLSALVQLRVQHASNGQAMPSAEDVRRTFFGADGMSQIERLLSAPMNLPFDGTGSMQGAIMDPTRTNWKKDIKTAIDSDKRDNQNDPQHKPLSQEDAVDVVHQWREGERRALIDWVKTGASQKAYVGDNYELTEEMAAELRIKDKNPQITPKYLDTEENGRKVVKVQSIIYDRCVRCHQADKGFAGQYPLETYDDLVGYTVREKSGGMSLPKLAQSTHVHLLGFAVLWCLTGLIVACTGFPLWMRALVGPWTLVAQIADITCWWLAGENPQFAHLILITGGLVGIGLCAQMLMGFWDLFRGTGRVILFLVLILIGLGVARLYVKVVEPRFKNGHSLPVASVVERAVSG